MNKKNDDRLIFRLPKELGELFRRLTKGQHSAVLRKLVETYVSQRRR